MGRAMIDPNTDAKKFIETAQATSLLSFRYSSMTFIPVGKNQPKENPIGKIIMPATIARIN